MQALYVNSGCLKCILGMNSSPANKKYYLTVGVLLSGIFISKLLNNPLVSCSFINLIFHYHTLHILMKVLVRGYFRLKLSSTSGCCPWWFIFFKNLFYQKKRKEAMNIGGGQISGTLFNFFEWKSVLFASSGCCPQFLQ